MKTLSLALASVVVASTAGLANGATGSGTGSVNTCNYSPYGLSTVGTNDCLFHGKRGASGPATSSGTGSSGSSASDTAASYGSNGPQPGEAFAWRDVGPNSALFLPRNRAAQQQGRTTSN